jgi:hypothetical protein
LKVWEWNARQRRLSARRIKPAFFPQSLLRKMYTWTVSA